MYKTSIKYKLSMLWIKIKSPFRSIVYRIKRYFEIFMIPKVILWPAKYNDDLSAYIVKCFSAELLALLDVLMNAVTIRFNKLQVRWIISKFPLQYVEKGV